MAVQSRPEMRGPGMRETPTDYNLSTTLESGEVLTCAPSKRKGPTCSPETTIDMEFLSRPRNIGWIQERGIQWCYNSSIFLEELSTELRANMLEEAFK